jgi:thiol:disulfide interchange protein
MFIGMQTKRAMFAAAAACLLAMAALPAYSVLPDIYPPPSHAQSDIAAALKSAATTHKRVILDFGGNWCADCHVLDSYFHDAANRPLLEANFVLVHVNVEHMDANVDIASRYKIPLKKGVPAIAVLDDHGKLLYSQKTGEFESMRYMQSGAVTDFLMSWKRPAA